MNIEFLKQPFEHIIISDAISPDTLDKVYLEIEFLQNFLRTDTKFSFDSENKAVYSIRQDGGTHTYGNTARVDKSGIFLSDFTHQYRESVIYKTINNLLRKNVYDFNQHSLLHGYLNSIKCQDFTVLVSYYENENYYDEHVDACTMTALLYLKPFGDCYTGGNLIFPNFNYEYVAKDNSMIIFPSFVWHKVNKISTTQEGTVRIAVTAFIGN